MSFETFPDTFPPPWKADEYAGVSTIVDSKGNEVDTALRNAFAAFVVELVNTHADALARKDALLAEAASKIEELRKERKDATAQRDAALAESDDNRTRLLDERTLAAGHSRALNSANVEIEQLKARLAEVTAERETAIDDAAELHALFGTQQELIERLQARIKRLEARA